MNVPTEQPHVRSRYLHSRRKRALEFQSVVDKLFSYGGTRSESDESPIGLARRFRELAGFNETEIDEIAEVSLQSLNERKQRVQAAREKASESFAGVAGAAGEGA